MLLVSAAGVLQADFLGYLQAFTDTPASSSVEDAEGKQRRPFLKRTLIQPPAASPEERDLQALQATEIRNGLECKFSTSTSKVGSLLLWWTVGTTSHACQPQPNKQGVNIASPASPTS